jgi:hypothetical protein
MNAAQVIANALEAAGYRTKRAQAAVLGEYAGHWGRYVAGGRSPQCSKVQGWLVALKAAGVPLVLMWDAEGVC